MAATTYTDTVTLITADTMNDLNRLHYTILGDPTTIADFPTVPTATTALNTTNTNGQIPFPATQNPSADVNTLDDYEEGTWTPTLGGTATYTAQTGFYTKIGRQVTVLANLAVNSIGTGSTTTISGLPFASLTSGGCEFAIPVSFLQSSVTAVVSITGHTSSGSSAISFILWTAASVSDTTASIFQNGTVIRCSGTYFTN